MLLDYCSTAIRLYPKIPLTCNSTATKLSQIQQILVRVYHNVNRKTLPTLANAIIAYQPLRDVNEIFIIRNVRIITSAFLNNHCFHPHPNGKKVEKLNAVKPTVATKPPILLSYRSENVAEVFVCVAKKILQTEIVRRVLNDFLAPSAGKNIYVREIKLQPLTFVNRAIPVANGTEGVLSTLVANGSERVKECSRLLPDGAADWGGD